MARLSLDERLNRIEDKISEKSFRENKGLGNEVGYYVFDYDPRAELEVRNHIAYLKDRINNGNKDFRIIEFDLFHIMIQVLEEEGYLEAFFDLEKENGLFDMADSLVETLGLDETNELNLIISKILQEDLTDSVVFLTGVGKCHPVIASHNILNNLHQVLDSVPVGYCNTKVVSYFLNLMNPTINIMPEDLRKLPCPLLNKKIITDLVSDNIQISREDWDSFENSWDFKYHPLICKETIIENSFNRWQIECDDRFNQMKINEEKLNRIFIDFYRLQDELSPKVEDKDITVRKADLSRDIHSFISYAVGCMFGRYSLDKEGLVYAGGDFEEYYKKVEETSRYYGLADADGNILVTEEGFALSTRREYYGKIKVGDEWKNVSFDPDLDNCIPITDEDYFSDDIVGRFVKFVKTVYGVDTLEENLDFIARALGNKGDTSREVIRNYFLKDFYADHLKVYQKRPIYWLFDSGKQNGFKALIYMHRYDADTVGRVRTDYLHRAQKYVETAMQSAQYTIDNATSASEKSKATKAVTKYTKQLAEMKIYDEAIAHIANQRIEIDLDDGVKVNYAKFQGVEVAQEGKKALKVDLLAKIK